MPVMLPNAIENETPADAVEVEQNFNVLASYTNSAVITRDGTVAMQAPLQLFGDPVGDDDAVRKAYVDAILPIGIILPYAGITVPAGKWAACNGASVQTAVYPKLFQVCQYRYGGSGGNFSLPDLRGRFPIGINSGDSRFNTAGDKGGAWDAKLPYHRHQIDHNHASKATTSTAHSHTVSASGTHNHGVSGGAVLIREAGTGYAAAGTAMGGVTHTLDGDHTHTVSGGSHSHNVDLQLIDAWSTYAGTDGVDQVPPYLTINFVIRVD
jgi:microcystin-dependent protein